MSEDIFNGLGIEIRIGEPDDFLKIKETLSRIGVASRKDKTLYQSCHILHKQGRYAIVHFKEMMILDGRKTDFSTNDKARRNMIAKLLQDWDLLRVIEPERLTPLAAMSQIKILPHKDKEDWTLVAKYTVGKKS